MLTSTNGNAVNSCYTLEINNYFLKGVDNLLI